MKGAHQGQRQTARSQEATRSCWDDFEAVRGQMDRLLRQRSRRTPHAEGTGAAREDDGGRRLV
ncbi:hypothetical protein [Streptomyces sp. AP-93]|uniref:hypothetical protein n=1 Tax=Streptomyces sp. AP-93 TaxID=2929048 RepID=UPI001FAEEFBF|nr:hypothetical protein [Streptomyces sp. AP-93]MCJ0869747.1 hypothetical protein [Streptomyces sp. AP-93]